jgi:hypothetical protein
LDSFHANMQEYRKQLEKGVIIEAYRGLMDYFNSLRLYFEKKYPNHSVSGSVYHGYMDMSYFSFTPKTLRQRKLKIAIVFLHEAFRFEVWLGGANKKVQNKYWKLIKENNWNKYSIPSTIKGIDSIIECVLIDNPDFSDLDALTEQIENDTLKFIDDVEDFLSVN